MYRSERIAAKRSLEVVKVEKPPRGGDRKSEKFKRSSKPTAELEETTDTTPVDDHLPSTTLTLYSVNAPIEPGAVMTAAAFKTFFKKIPASAINVQLRDLDPNISEARFVDDVVGDAFSSASETSVFVVEISGLSRLLQFKAFQAEQFKSISSFIFSFIAHHKRSSALTISIHCFTPGFGSEATATFADAKKKTTVFFAGSRYLASKRRLLL